MVSGPATLTFMCSWEWDSGLCSQSFCLEAPGGLWVMVGGIEC